MDGSGGDWKISDRRFSGDSLNDSGTGIVFSRDRGGDVWLTWFKKDDSAFVEFGQDGMLLLDAVPSHHLPNVSPIRVERTNRHPLMVEAICEFQSVGTTGFEPATS